MWDIGHGQLCKPPTATRHAVVAVPWVTVKGPVNKKQPKSEEKIKNWQNGTKLKTKYNFFLTLSFLSQILCSKRRSLTLCLLTGVNRVRNTLSVYHYQKVPGWPQGIKPKTIGKRKLKRDCKRGDKMVEVKNTRALLLEVINSGK